MPDVHSQVLFAQSPVQEDPCSVPHVPWIPKDLLEKLQRVMTPGFPQERHLETAGKKRMTEGVEGNNLLTSTQAVHHLFCVLDPRHPPGLPSHEALLITTNLQHPAPCNQRQAAAPMNDGVYHAPIGRST